MGLTSTAFFYLLVAAVVVCAAAALLLWNRVRGPRALRLTQRLLLLALCELTAVAAVGAWINNSYGLYASWADLFGQESGAKAAMPGAPAERAAFTTDRNGFQETYFRGIHSKLAGQVLVWTPPQYGEPAYRSFRFPVIMLLHGVPGSPPPGSRADMPQALATMMAAGQVQPAVVVVPVIDPGGVDTDCSDIGPRRNATWLAQDVPALVAKHFRVRLGARSWGLAGLSTGGFCAVKLPMQYPAVFGAGAAMDSDPFAGDPGVLTDPAQRRANSPLELARSGPPVSLFVATSAQDRLSPPKDIAALQRAIRPPTRLAPPLILPTGGHNWDTFQRMYPTVFPWLSQQLRPAAPS
ncbi:alpha/beta hydrolase [Streptacidiphilus monticola]